MRRDGSGQQVPMAVLGNEAFSQSFELLQSAILRQSKFHISAKNCPIDLRLILNESLEHAAFRNTITQSYQGVPFAPNRGDASQICPTKAQMMIAKTLQLYKRPKTYWEYLGSVCILIHTRHCRCLIYISF